METISLEAVILVVKGIIKEYLIAFLLKTNCRSCLVGTSAKSQNSGQALKVSCFQTPSHQQTVEYYTAPFFPPHPSVCVCVCVWEREREREREHVLVHEFLPVCLCCGDFICFHILSLWPFGRGKLTFVYFLEFQTNKVTFTLTPEIVREVRYLMIIQYLQF